MLIDETILNSIAIEQALAELSAEDAQMMRLIYRWEIPDDWTSKWPPRFNDIGIYIGLKYRGKALSEATIRFRRNKVKRFWRERYGSQGRED